jgi:ABC-type antimicrobial peptide transport system permease subunit
VAVVAMGSAAVLAILVPARRISRIHPAGALKAE